VRAVALIPARSGSQGIPGKNLAPVGGRPLLAWTVDAARGAERVTDTVVSTDGEEIGDVARELGAEVLARPAGLAGNETPMLDVVLHAAAALGEPDVLVLLQPTSPLRRAEHVDAALRHLVESGADAVVSVVRVPHQFLPESVMVREGDRVRPVDPAAQLLRQAKADLWARNGPAVLALRMPGLAERGFYGGDVRALEMAEEDSLDVDTPFDLRLADLLLAERARP
jgi:CMP-N,N'-diacetyllegionaminic acid synthase